ncbi:MAG: hypothetical protein RLY21_199 [Planctomycetota bacterium]|jgi:hypothetical protein
MFKLLRQYNQWILAVGGTLLLIAFLMPSAIQSCAQQSAISGAPWATYGDGKELTGEDLDQARKELAIVELLRGMNPQNDPIGAVGAHEDPAHWWLLSEEANLAGLVGGAGEGEATLAAIAAANSAVDATVTADTIVRNLMRASGANRDFVLSTTAKWRGAARLVTLCQSVDRISDKRLEQFVARGVLGMSGDIVVLDARKNPAIPTGLPAEAQLDAKLEEQLKKYADKPAPFESGKDNFGYRLPDRVKIEWLTISKSAVEATVQNSPELQSLALKKRFAQDPAKYGADPALNPSFSAYEATVRSRTVEDLTKAKLDEVAKFASDQLSLAQRALKRRNSYFELPENWATQMPTFDSISAAIASEFGVPAPIVRTSGDAPIALEAIGALEGLGFATTQRFGSQMRATQLIGGAKELSNPNITAPIQARVASPALADQNGDVVFFRITEALPSTPATELASMREKVLSDVMALERFQWLSQNESAITQQAAAEGLRAVADKYGAKVEFAKEIRQFAPQFLAIGFRMPSPLPGLGSEPKALEALIDKASALPLTTDLSTIPAAERTFVVASPDRLSLVLMQVTELYPVSRETMAGLLAKPEIIGAAREDLAMQDLQTMFGFDALASRLNFKRIRVEGEDDADANPAEVAAGETSKPASST